MKIIGRILFFLITIVYSAEESNYKKLTPFYTILSNGTYQCQFPFGDDSDRKCAQICVNMGSFRNHYNEYHESKKRVRGAESGASYQRQLVRLAEIVPCPVQACQKAMRKSSVYLHLQTMHPEYKRYSCTHCDQTFSMQREAKSHEKEHFNTNTLLTALKVYDDAGRVILTQEEATFLNKKVHYLNTEDQETFEDYTKRLGDLFARELQQKGNTSVAIERKVQELITSYERCPKVEGSLFNRKKSEIFTIPESERYEVTGTVKDLLDQLMGMTSGLHQCDSKKEARELLKSNIKRCLETAQEKELQKLHIGKKRTASQLEALDAISKKYETLRKQLHEVCSFVPMHGEEYGYDFQRACLKVVEENNGSAAAGEEDLSYNVAWHNCEKEVINRTRLNLLQGFIDEIAESVQEDDDRVDYCAALREKLSHRFDGNQNKIDEYMIWFNRVFQEENESEKPVIKRGILVVEEDQRVGITKEQQIVLNASIRNMREEHVSETAELQGLKFYENLDAFKNALKQKIKEHYNAFLRQAQESGNKNEEELDILKVEMSKKYNTLKGILLQLPCYDRDEAYRIKPGAVRVIVDERVDQTDLAE